MYAGESRRNATTCTNMQEGHFRGYLHGSVRRRARPDSRTSASSFRRSDGLLDAFEDVRVRLRCQAGSSAQPATYPGSGSSKCLNIWAVRQIATKRPLLLAGEPSGVPFADLDEVAGSCSVHLIALWAQTALASHGDHA